MAKTKIQINETLVDIAPVVPWVLYYVYTQTGQRPFLWLAPASFLFALLLQYVWDRLAERERHERLMAEIKRDRKRYGW